MRLVIKVGTGVLTKEDATLDGESIVYLVGELARLIKLGHEVILVSSGAVGAGVKEMGLCTYPQDIALRQACAAVGQPRLMHTYSVLFAHFDIKVAQLLVCADDFAIRHDYVQSTLHELLAQRCIIPIINENDTVAIEELSFGDNDQLSVQVAKLMQADVLVLLSSVEGLMTQDTPPQVIDIVHDVQDVTNLVGKAINKFSMGGMEAKLQAIQRMTSAGIRTVLANGRHPERILPLIQGEEDAIGTIFTPYQHD